jgi:hypothetical protein
MRDAGPDLKRLPHGVMMAKLKHRLDREGTYGKLHRYAQLWLAESHLIEDETLRTSRCMTDLSLPNRPDGLARRKESRCQRA